ASCAATPKIAACSQLPDVPSLFCRYRFEDLSERDLSRRPTRAQRNCGLRHFQYGQPRGGRSSAALSGHALDECGSAAAQTVEGFSKSDAEARQGSPCALSAGGALSVVLGCKE